MQVATRVMPTAAMQLQPPAAKVYKSVKILRFAYSTTNTDVPHLSPAAASLEGI